MKCQSQSKKCQKEQDKLNEQLNKEGQEIIDKYGLVFLLDACIGSINKLLIEKGVFTMSELRTAYSEGIKKVAKKQEEKARLEQLELDSDAKKERSCEKDQALLRNRKKKNQVGSI